MRKQTFENLSNLQVVSVDVGKNVFHLVCLICSAETALEEHALSEALLYNLLP